MTRQERRQMRLHADRSHAGAAAAVRNAECLVQIEVTDVGPEVGGPAQSDLRVHVGAVQIDLTAVPVHELANLDDARLEHAVGRRIGDHDGGQRFRMALGLGAQIIDVHVAAFVAGDDDHLHAGHVGRGRIGSVRRCRNEADAAMGGAAAAVIGADGEEPGIFPLRAGIRLQRHRIIAGDRAQTPLEVSEHQPISLGLRGRGERMQGGKLRPGDRYHFGGRVELHRAGAERDHAAVERQVAIG